MLIQLQYMRAIAALLVVYFHSVLQLGNLGLASPTKIPIFGECGVDLFLVLSGFVMWITTADRTVTPTQFYARRIKRIVPLYWTVTLAAAAVAFVAPQLLRSTVFDIRHLLASLFFIPWTNPALPAGNIITPVVIPGWTLNYEMYFYLIFGIVLLLRENLRPFVLLLVLLGVFSICQILPDTLIAAVYFRNPVVFEFAAGVFVGQLYLRNVKLPETVSWGLIVFSLLTMVVNDALDLTVSRLWIFGIPAILILVSVISIDFTKIRPIPALRYLGDASYSIYLTHVFVLTGTRIVFLKLPVQILQNPVFFLVMAMSGSILVGCLVHQFYEARINSYFQRGTTLKPA